MCRNLMLWVWYLFCNLLHSFPELMDHVTHLQSFVAAKAVEVLLVGHAVVQLGQRIPPGH